MTDFAWPTTDAGLCRLAADCVEEVMADDRYEIDTGEWHNPVGETCLVCVAGAVMAKRLGVERYDFSCPSCHPTVVAKSLHRIDELRYDLDLNTDEGDTPADIVRKLREHADKLEAGQ